MKSYNLPAPVTYWRWITPNTIALVTAASVFHWSIEGDAAPVKIFDRNPAVGEGSQIINYCVSGDNKWCLLSGISAGATPGTINGNLQLYSIEKQVSQMLVGHIGAFTVLNIPGRDEPAQVLVFEEKKPDQPPKLFIMEVGRNKDAPGGVFRVTPQNIPVPADAANDFPVTMNVSKTNGFVYMISKMGYLYLFDVFSGKPVYRARITMDTVFASTEHSTSGGILCITRKGQVLHVGLNEASLVPYVVGQLRDQELAIAVSSRLNLAGADDLYVAQFNQLIAVGDVQGAARVAADSPRGFLRTPQTIQKFQAIPPQPGQPQPVFQYFSVLLEKGKLNGLESVELAKPVVQQGRVQLLDKWIGEEKLEFSEELGDLVMPYDVNMALTIYLRANTPDKVINCYMQRGEFDKIVTYATRVKYHVDYSYMLQQLVRTNPAGALEFAKKLANNESGVQLIDSNTVLEIFMQVNLLREATAFLLEALKGNRKEEGFLQTRLLEINFLGGMPQVADAILGNEMFTHYDRPYIGRLCEQYGLFQRALEHYTDIADIKRVLQTAAAALNPEFIITYFGSISKEGSLEILKDLLSRNIRQNLNIVVQVATKYSDPLGPESLIKLFEDFKTFEGLFYYLGAIVNFSQSSFVHFKYIEAAARMQQFKEVERVCRDSTVYNPEEVKKFLMEAKLPDPRPLIHVCDRYDFVEELTAYLYSNNLQKYIEVYVQKVSPQKTPQVVGKLLDLEANEEFIRNLLNAVGQMCPAAELVEQVERRNRLRLVQPWLEARIAQGNTETAVHNAIGKIYITLNRDPLQFLQNNQFYDPHVIGAFCEKLDPHLAFVAYKHARGECDDALIKVTQENGLFKDLARYLVERQDLELWRRVLRPEGLNEGDPEPPSRRYLIDQIVQTALPEARNPDEVSTTVKAFMQCDMPEELIELLERIVLQGSEFSNNKNLQNLLILTAIRAAKEKVMEYINRLDNFDGPDIAKIAASDANELFEEAFTIYVKFGKKSTGEEQIQHHVAAVEILVDKIRDLERAKEFAERVNAPAVWSKLARAQIDHQLVTEAVNSYIKAKDPNDYILVINTAEGMDNYEDLVPYLKMARKIVKESIIDTQLIYALARVNKLAEMEEIVSVPNVAKIDQIGERCFDEGLFEAAKILFININNNAKLALCYINLAQYREAVDAATKANSISTWKEVNLACLRAEEFRLANICGLHIIVHPDHLEELIGHYERAGRSTELIQLMEQGLGLDNAHSGIFTELGVLYSKYLPEKLMEHIKIFWSRMNVTKLLRACERALLWNEMVYLYKEDGQHDSAVRTMIEHSVAFQHDLFLDCVQKVRNPEVQYKAITFYIQFHPLQLNRLLQVLTPHLDHARCVHLLRKNDALPLGLEYMKSVQKENLSVVNEAINELAILEEDYEGLRHSIDDFDNFDQIYLAQKVEKHELLEFRRIAAYLYKRNKRWLQSVQLSKEDRMYKDAIDTAAESGDVEIAEDLLRFFVSVADKPSFAATLYTCYDLIRPDVVLELAWRNGYTDFAMPFMYVSSFSFVFLFSYNVYFSIESNILVTYTSEFMPLRPELLLQRKRIMLTLMLA
jgi:clathrin heavy chain